MNIEVNDYELYYFLESALKGGTEHSSILRRFIDDFYHILSKEQQIFLWQNAIHRCYCGCFIPSSAANGLDKLFMARYNPENEYEVTYKDALLTKTVNCFRLDGLYYINSVTAIEKDNIISAERI